MNPNEPIDLSTQDKGLELEQIKLEQMRLELEMQRMRLKTESSTPIDETEKSEKYGYPKEATPLVYLSMILPPLGLYFVWRHPKISRIAKIVITIIAPLTFLLARHLGLSIIF